MMINGKVVLPDDTNENVLLPDDSPEVNRRKILDLSRATDGNLYWCLQGDSRFIATQANRLTKGLGIRWRVADVIDHRPGWHTWIELLPPVTAKA